MTTHRFFLKTKILDNGPFTIEDHDTVHQVKTVLRMKPGETVALFNGSGFDFLLEISRLDASIEGIITEKKENTSDPKHEVHLFQAILKKDNFEFVLQKTTEIGVKFFHPFISERSVKFDLNYERAWKIMKEATEQSGQDKIPELLPITNYGEALSQAKGWGTNIVFHSSGGTLSLIDKNDPRINIFVGPEGGFSKQEVEIANEIGATIVSLGARTLRAETAAILAAGIATASEH